MSRMFTGIIQYVGRVESVADVTSGRRIGVDLGPLAERLIVGASVAVDGACLTASRITGNRAEFDVVPQTLKQTTLGELTVGSEVNLEPAISADAALDGHIVQGHIDATANLARTDHNSDGVMVTLTAADELTDQMVSRGSITLAGVSLTLANVEKGRFSVALVPTTLERTTFRNLRAGDRLNVELDIIGKYVRRHLENLAGKASPLTMENLRQAGFA